MPRCPLCKTQYADGVDICKIDGTSLVSIRHTSPVPGDLPEGRSAPNGPKKKGAYSILVEGEQEQRRPAGKGAPLGLNYTGNDEVTTAAKPPALAARARGNSAAPPRLATGSATVAPQSKKDEWAAPFLNDEAPQGLEGIENKSSEEWVGQTLGSYKLLSILGKGGMGCVYRAEHVKLGRDVALKVLRTDYAKRKDAVARFFQEARAVNKVRHRNIVDVTDLVELDNGIVFIIMEYLVGAPLSKLMYFTEEEEEVDVARYLGILVQICDGLAAAHSVGIVHRDLKPDNIIVVENEATGQDTIKLLDFGVAKLLDKQEGDDIGLKTVAGSVVGTPAFMSPEQAGGLAVDGRADLYSLGAIMYEIFAGQSVFLGKSFGDYVRMHLNDTPIPPSETQGGRDLDPAIEEVIMRCLKKSPDARFQTAQDLRAELLSLLAAIEDTGEMTDHLKGLSQADSPSGAARPSGYDSRPSAPPPMTPAVLSESQQVHFGPSGSQDHGPPPAEHGSGAYGANLVDSRPMHGYEMDSRAQSQEFARSGSMPMQSGYQVLGNTNRRNAALLAGGIACLALAALLAFGGGNKEAEQKEQVTDVEALDPEPTTEPTTMPTTEPSAELVEVKPDETVVSPKPGVQGTEGTAAQERRFVDLEIDSDPKGAVFAIGSETAICDRTPCELHIDTADGGSADRRDYIVRAENYIDKSVTVNLRDPREKIFVGLELMEVETTETTKTTKTTKTEPTTPRNNKNRNNKNRKPKCKAGAQDTFNPFGNKAPCRR